MNDKMIDKPEFDAASHEVEQESAPITESKKGLWASFNAMSSGGKALTVGGVVTGVVVMMLMAGHVKSVKETNPSTPTANFQPTADFGIPQEQQNIESKMLSNVDSQTTQEAQQLSGFQSQQNAQSSEISTLQSQLTSLQNAQHNEPPATNASPFNPGGWSAPHMAPLGGSEESEGASAVNPTPMETFSLSYAAPGGQQGSPFDRYVPAGTFVRAVLLGGADASAAAGSQGDTAPILFRLLDNGTEPNDKRSMLKNCVVTAQTYGDISSERGMVRLDRLSCNYPDGTVLDIPVYGTAYDIGGKDGIRGIKVLRNGPVLTMSFIAGLAQGFGQAFQNAQTTQTPNLAGTTSTTVSPSSSLAYAGFGGASVAAQNLSNYYIQLANLYHPIIELNAGAQVDLVFTQGFSTNPNQTNKAPKPLGGDDSRTNPYGFASPPQTQSWQMPPGQQGTTPANPLANSINPGQ